VSEEKGKFYCFGCNEYGDVFDFVMKVEGVNFKAALNRLGIAEGGTKLIPKPRKSPERQAAETITGWARDTSLIVSAKMRTLLERVRLAKGYLSIEGVNGTLMNSEIENCLRQWELLNILDEDLFNPQLLPELWKQREAVEAIIHG